MDADRSSALAGRGDRRKRVFLHVGSPKTGTTFLQQVLWSQRQLALEQGLLLPLHSFYDHFLASADVRELSSEARFPPRAVGIWSRAVEEGSAWHGNVLVSHELFAGATAAQAERAVRAWGDADVHVILTARDLARQIPAEWQEHLKHRSSVTFGDFVDELQARGPAATWFWTVQDYADVCRRWGAAVPPENIHLVTIPDEGSDPAALWHRFAGLLRLDPGRFDLDVSRANTSLRAEQSELLRRVNGRLGKRLPLPGPYPETVKDVFAQGVLAGRSGTRVALGDDQWAFAVTRSQQLVDELRQLGVHVIGDLSELIPADLPLEPDDRLTDRPEAIPDTVLLAESVEALAGLLERFSKEHSRAARRELQAALDACRSELTRQLARGDKLSADYDKLVHDMRYRPLRHFVIGQSERRPGLMRLRVAYWRVVNLARRIAGRGRSA